MANEQPVQTSERLWSEEVEATDPSKEDKTAYQWNNGKKFDDGQAFYVPS